MSQCYRLGKIPADRRTRVGAHQTHNRNAEDIDNTHSIPSSEDSVPSNTKSVPSNKESVPSNTESVPCNREAIPINTESIPNNQAPLLLRMLVAVAPVVAVVLAFD